MTIELRLGHKMVQIHAETDTVGNSYWKHLFLYLQRENLFAGEEGQPLMSQTPEFLPNVT